MAYPRSGKATTSGRQWISLGVERFERVLVIFENDIRFPEVLLGIVRAGAVAVPVNFKFQLNAPHCAIRKIDPSPRQQLRKTLDRLSTDLR